MWTRTTEQSCHSLKQHKNFRKRIIIKRIKRISHNFVKWRQMFVKPFHKLWSFWSKWFLNFFKLLFFLVWLNTKSKNIQLSSFFLFSVNFYLSPINYVVTLCTTTLLLSWIILLNVIKVKIIYCLRRRLRATFYSYFILGKLHCNTSRRVICCFRSVRRIRIMITI